MGTTTALMSLEEFERIEQGPDEIELLRGELIRVPPPQRPHMEIGENVYDLLKAAVGRCREADPGVKLGKVHIEMGYFFTGSPHSWLRPDVSLTWPDQPGKRYYEGAPMIVFEVVSENDTALQLESKVAEYLANGAAEVWVIYPETRHAWVYQRSTPTARRETHSIRSDLLPGIEIGFGEIFK